MSKFKENIFESLVLEVSINSNKKLILANIYRPNNHKVLSNSEQLTTFFEIYENFLHEISNLHKPVYVFADMNIDLLKISSNDYARSILEMSASVGLNQLISKATRIQGVSFSLIDHIYTNVDDSWGAVLVDSFSDHFATVCSVIIKKVKHKDTPKKCRIFSKFNMEKFRKFLTDSTWASVYASNCPNEAWNIFWDFFYTAFEQYFPLKVMKLNKSTFPIMPFMTKGLLVSRSRKLKLDLIRKNNPSVENNQSYKSYLNLYSKLIRLSKKKYYDDQFSKCSRDSKKRGAYLMKFQIKEVKINPGLSSLKLMEKLYNLRKK